MNILQHACLLAAFVVLVPTAHAAGSLEVEDAWIREAPPGATMLAGYATLKNRGDARLLVLLVESDAFEEGSMHETVLEGGVSKMRELERIEIEPGAQVRLEPGGKHLMLMQPRHAIVAGSSIGITFVMADNTRVEAPFVVRGIGP